MELDSESDNIYIQKLLIFRVKYLPSRNLIIPVFIDTVFTVDNTQNHLWK